MGQTTAHGTFVYMLNLQDTLTRTSSCYPPQKFPFLGSYAKAYVYHQHHDGQAPTLHPSTYTAALPWGTLLRRDRRPPIPAPWSLFWVPKDPPVRVSILMRQQLPRFSRHTASACASSFSLRQPKRATWYYLCATAGSAAQCRSSRITPSAQLRHNPATSFPTFGWLNWVMLRGTRRGGGFPVCYWWRCWKRLRSIVIPRGPRGHGRALVTTTIEYIPGGLITNQVAHWAGLPTNNFWRQCFSLNAEIRRLRATHPHLHHTHHDGVLPRDQ